MIPRKGKVKPFDIMSKDATGKFVDLFISMGDITGSVDVDAASEFVCQVYAQYKTRDVNEARYNKMLQMTGKIDQVHGVCDSFTFSFIANKYSLANFSSIFCLFFRIIPLQTSSELTALCCHLHARLFI